MSARAPHLQDDSLSDCYFAERRGEPLDPPAAEHLADCASCAERYAEFVRFMTSLREEAGAEVDAWFPAERLRAQQQEIARRLDHIGRAARVISFPGRAATRRIHPSTTRMARRWIAGAAAAGLFVGVAAGTFFDFSRRLEIAGLRRPSVGQQGMRAGDPAAHLVPVRVEGTETLAVEADDLFMSALELALDRPHTSELVAFDALTPHMREIGLTR
jgi:hypothetical protein